MKRILLIVLMSALCCTSIKAWKPIFVGHRGSYTGVQNTVEAFQSGVDKYGYTGLECDVRVTSDGQYVIMHDETTNSLGGSLTVASATLEQLQAEELVQTRGGVRYTGKICTVDEYLAVCKDKNAFPVIELKWTTGINNNDMSNFPGLYELVKKHGLESQAIFLTSMKKSIEYIRTNYPEAKCQFLTGEYWASHFDWCVLWNVEPSIQIGYFDIYTVKKFRDVGLNVAMWTVNSTANYQLYGNMGVYMMTCDYLYPNNMAELEEIDWSTVVAPEEALELECETLFKYTYVDNNLPANFPNYAGTNTDYTTGQQSAYYDGIFYVSDYGTQTLLTFDTNGQMVENAYTGTDSHGIAVDDAGNLIIRADGITSNPSKLLVCKKGETEPKEINFTLNNPGQTNFITASGDIFSPEGGYVYFFPNKQTVVDIMKIADGKLLEITTTGQLSLTGSTAGYVIPIDNNPEKFIYQVRANGYYLYDGADKGAYVGGSGNTTQPNRNNSIGGAYFVIGGHEFFAHCSGSNYNGGFTIRDMSAGSEPVMNFAPIGSLGYSGNISCGSFFAVERIDENSINLYEYCMAGGYAGYKISVKGSGVKEVASAAAADAVKASYSRSSGTLTVKYGKGIKTVEIYGIDGRQVSSVRFDDSSAMVQLDASGIGSGIYVVRVNGMASAKFIK